MSDPGFIPCFRTLQQLSVPGAQTNEDGLGARARHAWIIDGATGVAGAHLTPGRSDAAWLAACLGDVLQACANESAETLFSSLEAQIGAAFSAVAPGVPAGEVQAAPSACLGVIHCRDAAEGGALVIEGAFLGDVVALVPTPEGLVRWTDERAKPFERRTLATLGRSDRETGVMPEETRLQILENRTRLNQPDGYWVVHPLRPWAGRELRFEARVAPGQPIVLATDGFMRLVDVFDVYTDETLYAALGAGQALGLMQELRELEQRDDATTAFPRVKVHDDATVLVVALHENCKESRKGPEY
ncbi:hypothetical protein [Microvirga flavescens]|uniref:hypothetical protein n=1 Tax=Microvirga flavescens TaxID=2249811 RepID=UPI0013001F15|nr:hypothetical protein [Microvirga flavescens]